MTVRGLEKRAKNPSCGPASMTTMRPPGRATRMASVAAARRSDSGIDAEPLIEDDSIERVRVERQFRRRRLGEFHERADAPYGSLDARRGAWRVIGQPDVAGEARHERDMGRQIRLVGANHEHAIAGPRADHGDGRLIG